MSFDTNPESRDDACDKEGDRDCAQTREAVSAKPLRMPSRFGAASAMCQTRAFAAGPSIASRDVGGAIRDLKIPDERGRLMGSAHVPVPVGFRRLPAPAETARYDSWGECPRTPAGGHRPHGPARDVVSGTPPWPRGTGRGGQDAIVVRLAIVRRLPERLAAASVSARSPRRSREERGSPRRRPLGHLVSTGAGRTAVAGTGCVPIA